MGRGRAPGALWPTLVCLALLLGGTGVGAASATGQAGEATIRIDGPTTIVVGNVVPPKFPATITFTYTGAIPPTPPGSPPSQVRTRFTLTLTNHMHSMETSIDGAADGCASASGPQNFWGPEWTTFSCTLIFIDAQRTVTLHTLTRPSGLSGTGSMTVQLDTGDQAQLVTTFARPVSPPPPPPPPPPPAAPAPLSGPAAAPTVTVAETFTAAGQAEAEAVRVSPKAETAQVALVWPAGSSFDATQFRIVSGGEVVAQGFRTGQARPAKLKVRKIRRARSLDVRITNLRPGKLHFKVVAKRVTGRARVVAKVRQSKR